MHKINLSNSSIRSDLIIEQTPNSKKHLTKEYQNVKITKTTSNSIHYTTISYEDITDKENFQAVQEIFIKELKPFINLSKEDVILVIGLGNNKSTPDSLGPYTIENILVTRYLFLLGDVEDGYSNVCSFTPNVTGNTGIETASIIKSIIKQTKASKVIVIDSLKTSNLSRLVKTIQITDKGISPGSGINNNRQEISKKTMGIDVIAIGVPTVVDIKSVLETYMEEEVSIIDNFIVTPTNIDFVIEKLGVLIGNGINISLHKNFIRQNNY